MRRMIWISLSTAIALAVPSAATEVTADPGMEAMSALAGFAGRWEGEGWMRRGPGEPSEFDSLELVERRLAGRVLIVEGTHHDKETGDLVHHALATISWDPEGERYRFRSHLADGRSGDHHGEMTEDGFAWGFQTKEGAHIRYLIRIEGDRWSEVGKYSADGENWQEFFGMNLRRVGSSESN